MILCNNLKSYTLLRDTDNMSQGLKSPKVSSVDVACVRFGTLRKESITSPRDCSGSFPYVVLSKYQRVYYEGKEVSVVIRIVEISILLLDTLFTFYEYLSHER